MWNQDSKVLKILVEESSQSLQRARWSFVFGTKENKKKAYLQKNSKDWGKVYNLNFCRQEPVTQSNTSLQFPADITAPLNQKNIREPQTHECFAVVEKFKCLWNTLPLKLK
jgi:hypothetical protein